MTAVAPGAPALAVSGACVKRGSSRVIDDLSFAVAEGSAIAIVGRNGAGKSTLMSALIGALPFERGEIRIDGSVVTKKSPRQRVLHNGIALVPEGRRLFAPMTVEDNLRVAAVNTRGEVWERLDLVYEMFPSLSVRRRLPAAQLSGGEAQMLAIGQALMPRPRILLLDEPSLGLAPIVVRQVIDILARLCRSGLAVVLAEQSLRMATAVTSDVNLLSSGKLVRPSGESGAADIPMMERMYLEGERALTDAQPLRTSESP